ncbi:hypothetical protein Teth39_0635 [Thermoanaerobacter pseudethanolicus ATCC 33223]|uniref:Uncharacterized protein n=5 Tax=Thermoanaerobacter TaxID=1754 RepID=B0K7Q0_THEP3|nr:hypothetical protein Teth39_0635 [Thermoanaerobacter pseudethanolicus ATCC 33223]ADV79248.1 hypothetical protein Thebr_0650 [Thermoanaerobacter brockii subsp. finnii Ako-1]EMT38221.1 hypothetical protein TthWC1_2265 [Thermoanaerobacter thermohydrosulfuricus WC1]HBW60244.1 hypothetical protein [Thermoanaerobacter sp.]
MWRPIFIIQYKHKTNYKIIYKNEYIKFYMKRVIAMKEEKEGLNAYLLVIVLSLILYFGLGYAKPEEPAIIIFPLPIR